MTTCSPVQPVDILKEPNDPATSGPLVGELHEDAAEHFLEIQKRACREGHAESLQKIEGGEGRGRKRVRASETGTARIDLPQ